MRPTSQQWASATALTSEAPAAIALHHRDRVGHGQQHPNRPSADRLGAEVHVPRRLVGDPEGGLPHGQHGRQRQEGGTGQGARHGRPVETDSDHGSPYEAHVRTSDGTEVEALVSKDLKVTDTNTIGPRR